MSQPKALRYTAGVEIMRAGVTLHIAEIPSTQLAAVVAHALKCLDSAGLVGSPDEPSGPIEQVGGYAPLDVRDDPFEQGKRRKQVGF